MSGAALRQGPSEGQPRPTVVATHSFTNTWPSEEPAGHQLTFVAGRFGGGASVKCVEWPLSRLSKSMCITCRPTSTQAERRSVPAARCSIGQQRPHRFDLVNFAGANLEDLAREQVYRPKRLGP